MLPEQQHFEEQAEAAADDVNESEVEADSTPSALVGDAEREEEAGSKKGGVAVVPRERADVVGAHSRSTEGVEDMLPIPMGEVDNIPDVLEVADTDNLECRANVDTTGELPGHGDRMVQGEVVEEDETQ